MTIGVGSPNGTEKKLFRFGSYELDQARFELRRSGVPLEVQPRVLEVLAYLVENHDRLVTKQELVEGPWRGTPVGDDSLYRAVLHARAALDAEPGSNPILTVRGRGLRFVWPVTVVQPTSSTAPEEGRVNAGNQTPVSLRSGSGGSGELLVEAIRRRDTG